MRKVTRTTKTTALTFLRTIFLLSLLVTTVLAIPSPFVTAVYAQDGDVLSQLDGAAQTVALAINQQRANAGLPLLALHPLLNLAAQNHVNDMVANYNYSHAGTDGSNVRQRVQWTGYGSAWASENWVSVSSPELAIQWWMNSRVHRGNILNTNWHEYGIGFGSHPNNGELIFVAVFAAGQNGDAAQIVMPPPAEPMPVPAGGVDYTVQAGDTLLSIGLRIATIYGISWEDLAAENRLNKSSVISVGEQLRIPGAVKRVEQPAEATTDENSVQATTETETVSAATTTTAESAAPEYYVVKTGDTIISIAVRNDMGWQELLTLNNLTENSILQLGQKVRVR